MRITVGWLAVLIVGLLPILASSLSAQHALPMAVVQARVMPYPALIPTQGAMRVLSDSAAARRRRWQPIVAGAAVGAALGIAAGYGLALLGHKAFCEGTAQCASRPDRAIRESTRGGLIIGASIGALVGWRIVEW
jgi:hypothetical protein